MIECEYIVEPDKHFTNTKRQCWEPSDTTHYDYKNGVWYSNGFRFKLPHWSDKTVDEVLSYVKSCKGIVIDEEIATPSK